jgi:hypothetical protein
MLSSAFQGTTLEQPKNGAVLVNASEATTWIDSAYLGGRRSIHLSYERTITATVILEHFWTIPKKIPSFKAVSPLTTFSDMHRDLVRVLGM